MTSVIYVTPTQIMAAKMLAEMLQEDGKPVPEAVLKIAAAKTPTVDESSRTLYVTPTQIKAAKMLAEMLQEDGKPVSEAVLKIAAAKTPSVDDSDPTVFEASAADS